MNTRRSVWCIGLVALFLSISTWTPVAIISTHPDNETYPNKNPQIAVDAQGCTHVTWQGHDGNDREIYWVRIDAEGVPGTVKKISIHPENMEADDWQPQIAVDAQGTSYVTWGGFDGTDYDIYWVKIDASGEQGAVRKISVHPEGTDFNDGSAQIAVDAAGTSYVTWRGSDGNDIEIYWVRIDAEGVPGTVEKISTHPDNVSHHDYDPQIAVDAAGTSYVVWHGCDKEGCWEEPGDFEIYWVRIDAEGVPGTVQKIPPTSPDNVNTMPMIPQLAVDAEGTSYVVWSGKDETSFNVYWVRIDSAGNLGTVQRVSAYPDSEHGDVHPETTVDTEGNLYITWECSEGKYGEIYWVRIDSAGEQGAVQMISDYLFSTSCDDWDPQIAVDAAGNSHVTWNSINREFAEKSDLLICWVTVDSAGNPGRVQKISDRHYSKHFDWNSRIAVDAAGNSYVIWVGQDESKHDHIFFTAHLPDSTILLKTVGIFIIIVALMVATGVIVLLVRKKKKTQIIQENENNRQ